MSTWVTTIVHNCVLLQLRKRRRFVYVSLDEPAGEPEAVSRSEQLADHRPGPEDEYQHSELTTRLVHFHAQLSPTLRRTFRLRDIDGLSIRETARILKVPSGTVKAQSARARKKLKELMRHALRPRSRNLPENQPGPSSKVPTY
jgi:RNA polymerase sigma-70 factor (ECF subfamily)